MKTEYFQPEWFTQNQTLALIHTLEEGVLGTNHDNSAQALLLHEVMHKYITHVVLERMPESLIVVDLVVKKYLDDAKTVSAFHNQYGLSSSDVLKLNKTSIEVNTSESKFKKDLVTGKLSPVDLNLSKNFYSRLLKCNSYCADSVKRSVQIRANYDNFKRTKTTANKSMKTSGYTEICLLVAELMKDVQSTVRACSNAKPLAVWLSIIMSSIPIRVSLHFEEADGTDASKESGEWKKASQTFCTPVMSSAFLEMFMAKSNEDLAKITDLVLFAIEETWDTPSQSFGVVSNPDYVMSQYMKGSENVTFKVLELIEATQGVISLPERMTRKGKINHPKY